MKYMKCKIEFSEEDLKIANDILKRIKPEFKPFTFDKEESIIQSESIPDYEIFFCEYSGSFSVNKIEINRGCHTLSNGDPGYPDEEEMIEMFTGNIIESIKELFKYLVEDKIDDYLDEMEEKRLDKLMQDD